MSAIPTIRRIERLLWFNRHPHPLRERGRPIIPYPIFTIPVRGPGLSRPSHGLNVVERALLAAACFCPEDQGLKQAELKSSLRHIRVQASTSSLAANLIFIFILMPRSSSRPLRSRAKYLWKTKRKPKRDVVEICKIQINQPVAKSYVYPKFEGQCPLVYEQIAGRIGI